MSNLVDHDTLEMMSRCDVTIESEGFRCNATSFAADWADGLVERAESELIGEADMNRLQRARSLFDVEVRSAYLFGSMLNRVMFDSSFADVDLVLDTTHQAIDEVLANAIAAQRSLREVDLENRTGSYVSRHRDEYRDVLYAIVDQAPESLLRFLARSNGQGSFLYENIRNMAPELLDHDVAKRKAQIEQRAELSEM